jgi:hypothetical protein
MKHGMKIRYLKAKPYMGGKCCTEMDFILFVLN